VFVAIRWSEGGEGVCWIEEARFDADADMQLQAAMIKILWTFSMRAAADGALLLSAWVEAILLGRHCLLKDWRYSQAV
jgi:hypothetical protein